MEEAALWADVTRDVTRDVTGDVTGGGDRSGNTGPGEPDGGRGDAARVPAPIDRSVDSELPPRAGVAKDPAGDRDLGDRTVRHLSRGRLAIDGVLDLHGMRQREAHAALRRFLIAAQARGHRYVTVVTGKGTRRSDEDGGERGDWAAPERGVLRRVVREWLDGPDLRDVVVGYSAAARGHGGDGALFVHVRRAERARNRN